MSVVAVGGNGGGGRGLTPYERKVLQELRAWKSPPRTLRARAADRAEAVIDRIASSITPHVIEDLVQKTLPIVNKGAGVTVSENAILLTYKHRGHPIGSLDDIQDLDLETIEAVVGSKRLREGAVGFVEGGIAGFFGAPGAAADIPASITLALRSVNLFAASYGFDHDTELERAHALSVLSASSSLGHDTKKVTRTAIGAARKLATKEAVNKVLQKLPQQLVTRLAAMNSSKVAPVIGLAPGAALGAWYLHSVACTSRMAYRQRFLERRHGPQLLEAFGL